MKRDDRMWYSYYFCAFLPVLHLRSLLENDWCGFTELNFPKQRLKLLLNTSHSVARKWFCLCVGFLYCLFIIIKFVWMTRSLMSTLVFVFIVLPRLLFFASLMCMCVQIFLCKYVYLILFCCCFWLFSYTT